MHEEKRDPLNLSRLPQPEPPGDPWSGIAAALQRRRRRRAGLWATAATVALSLGLAWHGTPLSPGAPPAGGETVSTASTGHDAQAETPPPTPDSTAKPEPTPPGSVTGAESLAALIALSQQLETRLRVVRARAGAMPAEALVYQVELEDLVAQVDDALSRRPESRLLWSQRVNLLLDLDQLYRQELRREQGLIASL